MSKTSFLAATAALSLCLTALAAPAEALTGFGTYAEINWGGGPYHDGGEGKGSASRSISLGTGASTVAGYAAADLFSGSLHSASLATHPACQINCSANYISSTAKMWDTVHFTKKNGQPLDTVALIPASIKVDGHLAGGEKAQAKFRIYAGYNENFTDRDMPWQTLGDGDTLQIIDDLFVPLTTNPMIIYVEIMTSVETRGVFNSFATADFGNTLHFDWDLPGDVAFTSASGQFMAGVPDPVSAVPEPATWALMITGFGLAGGAIRRRRAGLALA